MIADSLTKKNLEGIKNAMDKIIRIDQSTHYENYYNEVLDRINEKITYEEWVKRFKAKVKELESDVKVDEAVLKEWCELMYNPEHQAEEFIQILRDGDDGFLQEYLSKSDKK